MNRKGFTLIELIAVITIIAILAVIATPNVINMVNNGKKEQYVSDAKTMISKAKYMYKIDKYQQLFTTAETNCKTIPLNVLELDLDKDSDGNNYDKEKSKVKVCILNNQYVYSVLLVSNVLGEENTFGRGICDTTTDICSISSATAYVLETDISKDKVVNLSN